jgi:hypothetical protein
LIKGTPDGVLILTPCNFAMKLTASLLLLAFAFLSSGRAAEPRLVANVTQLPKALSDHFEFRKVKTFLLTDEMVPNPSVPSFTRAGKARTMGTRTSEHGIDPSIVFERQYRLHGAVTEFDKRQRYGNYFDFFWRSARPADVTVRLEYRQEKLRSFVQAREVRHPRARGSEKTEFRIIGDDYLDDGRIIAWRCLLIENGRIVAEERSYLWE